MTIISFETSSNKSTRDKKKNTFHSTEKGYIIRGQNAITHQKKKILYLGLRWWEILLGVSFLELGTFGLRLQLCILGLEDHIPNGKGVLKRLGFHWKLSLLTPSSYFWNFSISKRSLGGKELLSRRDRI